MVMTAWHRTQGDLRGVRTVFMLSGSRRAAGAGVRALKVATRRRNGRGAKGRRKRNS